MRTLFLCLALLLTACTRSTSAHPEESAVRQFLETYFSTWSAQDMDGYAACFSPQARISFVHRGGQTDTQGLTDFLHGQKLGHQSALSPMKEVPLSMEISGDKRVAQAGVRWKLTKGSTEETGLDYFTLIKTPSGWRIISLAFYLD
jgi:hypothetical protein